MLYQKMKKKGKEKGKRKKRRKIRKLNFFTIKINKVNRPSLRYLANLCNVYHAQRILIGSQTLIGRFDVSNRLIDTISITGLASTRRVTSLVLEKRVHPSSKGEAIAWKLEAAEGGRLTRKPCTRDWLRGNAISHGRRLLPLFPLLTV